MKGRCRGIACRKLHSYQTRHTVDESRFQHFGKAVKGRYHARAAAAGDQHGIRSPAELLHDAVGKGALARNTIGIWPSALIPALFPYHFPAQAARRGHVAVNADDVAPIDKAFGNLGGGDVLLDEYHGAQPRA